MVISNHLIGIVLDTATGWSVKDNAFATAGLIADILLETTTSGNTVVAAPGTAVTDLGTGNSVIFE